MVLTRRFWKHVNVWMRHVTHMMQCNTHCNTHCNTPCNTHCNTPCNTHCTHWCMDASCHTHDAMQHTLQHTLQHTATHTATHTAHINVCMRHVTHMMLTLWVWRRMTGHRRSLTNPNPQTPDPKSCTPKPTLHGPHPLILYDFEWFWMCITRYRQYHNKP